MQKCLLTTGDLNDSIQESLDLVVNDGRLNDGTAVCHESGLSTTTIFFKQNNNPLDVVYKNEAKFHIQNPIIGSLLKQIDSSKITSKGIKKTLSKAPNPKDIELQNRLNDLKGYNDVNNLLPPPSGFIPPPLPFDFFPAPNNNINNNNNSNNDNNEDDDDFPPPPSYFSYSARMPPVNEFLTPPTTQQNFGDSIIGKLEKPKEEEQQINLHEDLKNNLFDVDELLDNLQIKEGKKKLMKKKMLIIKKLKKIDKGKTPHELNFFVGSKNSNFEKNTNF